MERKTKILLLEFMILVVICSFDSRLLLGFLWVILHEAVHIIVAKSFGVNLYNIQIHITGAKAELQNLEDVSENKKLLIYFSGPLFNMILAIILMWIRVTLNVIWIESSIGMNIGLAVFNMLPAYPLDGIRIYEILLGKVILYKRAKKILVNVSFIFSGLLLVLFFLTVYIHKANFSLLLAAFLITYTTFLEKKNTIYILMGNLIKKRRRLIKDDYIENKSISVYYERDLVKVLSLVDRNKFNSFFVLDEELKFLGIVYEDELIEALKDYGNISLGDFIKIKKER
ncbi:site-2 protease family protein [Clostridium paraputrificum]|uniref:site-2 protease family protein n=1 Tax=Clostridium TaxID=1485 RepID=UPI003D337DA8